MRELGTRIFLNARRFDGGRIGQRIEGRSHDEETQDACQNPNDGALSHHRRVGFSANTLSGSEFREKSICSIQVKLRSSQKLPCSFTIRKYSV